MKEVHQKKKKKLTQWGLHMKVIKIGQEYCFEVFWWPSCDIKIDNIMCEPHCVKIFSVNLHHSQAVWLFDTWHIHVSHLVMDVFSEFSEYIH